MQPTTSKILLFLLALTLSACTDTQEEKQEEQKAPLPTVQVHTLTPGLTRSFSVTGETEAGRKSTIDADTKADIETIHVEIGDTVQKGQILILLSSDTVDTRLRNAQIRYDTSKKNVDQTKKINVTSIAQAQENYDTAQISLLSILDENASKKKQAQETFNASIVQVDLSVESAQTQLENELQTVHNTLNSAFSIANSIFEFNDGTSDIDYIQEVHIGARDPIATKRLRTNLKILDHKNRAGVYTLEKTMPLLKNAEREFEEALRVLDTSVTSAQYTQSNLSSDISALSSALSTINSAVSSLENAQDNIDIANQSTGTISQTYQTAQSQLQATLSQLDAAEVQAKRNVTQAKATLDNAINQAKGGEIGAVSTLNSIASELRSAVTSSEELVVRAPFSGKIQNIAVTDGDEVQAGQELITIENTDTVTIVASVTPEEIRTIEAGGPVRIGKDTNSFITSISPNADPVTKKYTVEIDTDGTSFQSGEFVNVEFTSNVPSNTDRYFVPISSVHIEETDTYLWFVDSSKAQSEAKKKSITIGNIQGRYIEVISGVEDGMQIIIEGSRNLFEDGTAVSVSQ